MAATKMKEKIGQAAFAAAAILCVIAVVAVFAFLFVNSLPAFQKIGVFSFLFGEEWSPDRMDTYPEPLSGTYGIFTMIVSTAAATAGALLFGGTIGYFTAVFLAFYCPRRLRRPLGMMINLLSGIPSVVYGFFGIVFLLPRLSAIAPNNGSGLLAVSLILGMMILPTVVSLARTGLEAVPRAYYEGSIAMGATHSETVFSVMSPAARSGILAALVLGIGRALGETMAVMMVAGNAATYPNGLFSSFRVLTANIAMEMGYAGEVQEGALVATGVVLLFFILLVNLLFSTLSPRVVRRICRKEAKEKKGAKRRARLRRAVRDCIGALLHRIHAVRIGAGCSLLAGILACAALLLLVGFILAMGLPYLVSHPSLIWGEYEFGSQNITVLPAILTTLWAVLLSVLIAVPLGIMTAIFLHEYAKKGHPLVRAIRTAIDILAGVPSIVYGLFGMMTFVRLTGGSSNILAGSMTVSLLLLPTVIRSTEESLRSVEDSLREGSLALGAGKLRTIFRVVLPAALPGILSAVMLSMGRVVSESAPFLYTMGSVISAPPQSPMDSGATLAVALYKLSGEGWYMNEAYGTAVILIFFVLGLYVLADLCGSRLERKWKGNA